MRAVADPQIALRVQPRGLQHVHFFQQCGKIHYHAITDYRKNAFPQNSAGNQFKNKLLFSDKYSVAGIMTALIAGDDIEAFSQ